MLCPAPVKGDYVKLYTSLYSRFGEVDYFGYYTVSILGLLSIRELSGSVTTADGKVALKLSLDVFERFLSSLGERLTTKNFESSLLF